ncbi:hypothetical protein HK100_008111 [Physocladia obscura]|uniref:Uncharacterized protein n=1 Tax=Physocladia obscura TaxID=109957 RepID=A0AAD5TAW9_9FUNG|nr:hypothetical protein HK100_008111 [Physocladia obscura]
MLCESYLLGESSVTGLIKPQSLPIDYYFDPCDPYALLERAARQGKSSGKSGTISKNGVFQVDKRLLDKDCPTDPHQFSDNLELLQPAMASLPLYLQNKMILLIGDSFERRLIEQICKTSNGTITKAMLNGAIYPEYVVVFAGGGDPHMCVIRKEAKVLILISVFNYGVRVELDPPFGVGSHWLPEFSPFEVRQRVVWIPHFLLAIANHTFPELCQDHFCPQSTSNTNPDRVKVWNPSHPFWFPTPDMIVAQSGIWDLKQRSLKNYIFSIFPAKNFAENWGESLKSELFDPLAEIFGFSEKFSVPSDNITLENMKMGVWKPSRREFSQEFGVLDWAALVENHHDWTADDGFHPNYKSNEAYWQYIFSRMEMNED